jgi:hypothetical protein
MSCDSNERWLALAFGAWFVVGPLLIWTPTIRLARRYPWMFSRGFADSRTQQFLVRAIFVAIGGLMFGYGLASLVDCA